MTSSQPESATKLEVGQHSSFLRYVKTRDGRFALLLVCACSLVLALFIGLTFVDPPDHVYHLDFGKAEWIQSATPSPISYFRKTIYIEGTVSRAWLQVASTDSYTLFVNGDKLGYSSSDGTCVAGLYDLRGKLRPGKNVIALEVLRDSFPGSAQLAMRGFYAVVGSPVQEFWSDPSDRLWRVSSTPDGIVDGLGWISPLLDDSFWQLPKLAPAAERFSVQAVEPDPRLLESVPNGKWITAPPGSSQQASFAYNLQLPGKRGETWLEVAATGNYDLIINGRPITTSDIPPPEATIASPEKQALTVLPSLAAYDVTRWLHAGTNSLLLRVKSQTLEPAVLLADGYTVLEGGKLQRFGTDETWDTLSFNQDRHRALVVANYGDQPWGYIPQHPGPHIVSPIYDLWKVLTWSTIIASVLGGGLALWVLSSALASLLTRVPLAKLWTCDALFLLCVLVVMLFLWLLTFDIRFDTNWCFKPRVVYGLVGFILAGRLLLLLPRNNSAALASPSRERPFKDAVRRYGKFLVLGGIVLLGFCLRFHNLTAISIDTDEFSLIQFSRGVQKHGYPSTRLGSFRKAITTYELVPYSIAASRQILGETEAAFRTPALIYSTITIALLGIAGARMLGWRQGLTAAFIFATCPFDLYWGINCFWPAQQVMLAVITFWCFYEAIRAGPLRHGFLTVATGSLILAYLSWEGSGFIIPTMFMLMFALRWGTYDWMKDWHLWRCFVVLSFAVGIQLTFRQVESQPPYLQTGISLSDVTTPEPMWLDLTRYSPDFFVRCSLAENFFLMTVLTVCGLVFCWRDRAVRYLALAIASWIFWLTEFLPVCVVRYTNDFSMLLILASVGTLYNLLDRITGLGASKLRWAAAGGLLATFILSTNGFVLQTYRLNDAPQAPLHVSWAYRMGIYRCGYRECGNFVAEHYRPGDAVVVSVPHIFEYYSHLYIDYSFNTMLDKKCTYDGELLVPHFIDKFRGVPCVRSLEELQDLRGRFKRIWIVQAPFELQEPSVTKYIARYAKVAFVTYEGEVDCLVGTSDPNQLYVR